MIVIIEKIYEIKNKSLKSKLFQLIFFWRNSSQVFFFFLEFEYLKADHYGHLVPSGAITLCFTNSNKNDDVLLNSSKYRVELGKLIDASVLLLC